LIDQEPQHIESLVNNCNLIPMIKYCLMKMGKYRMITPDFLVEVKKVVRTNILARVTGANNEKVRLFDSEPNRILKARGFLKDFVRTFTHQIFLDPAIATLKCQLVPDGGPTAKFVFEEFIELIHAIFCPDQKSGLILVRRNSKSEERSYQPEQTVNLNPDTGTQSVSTDFEELR
jgi:hypothetical protein